MHGNWSWVFEGDFKSCFDTLNHDFILKSIKGFPLYNLIEKFLKSGYVDNTIFHNSNKGTPQGGILSPLLANIALNGMEKVLNIFYRERKSYGKTIYETKGNYRVVRYADDFVIFANSKEDIEAIPEILNSYLEKRGLELAPDKTRITHILDGFDFLGFNFRRYRTSNGFKHLCKPSKDSIRQFKSKVSEICKQFNGHNVDSLIKRLNSLIRGTANYWKPHVAKDIFSAMDSYIWRKTYKFVRRLHSVKPWNWIKKRYYPFYDDGKHYGNWILTGPKESNTLIKMVWTPIRRHAMIQYNHSPYDKSKSEYFDKRKSICFG
jgi:RNA-directed DNA polymerase